MTLKEKVNADYMKAFKEKNTAIKNLLSVVKGEIQTIEKNTGSDNLSDEEVLKIFNKTSKSLKETIKVSDDEESKLQLVVVESYLPKLMSKEEVTAKVNELVTSGINQIGAIMKEFSNLPADKKMVSEAIKEIVK
jgi:uncharacterized protein YqeY